MKVIRNNICVIIGANQAGVTLAFSLREEGWQGGILLIDSDSKLPYARPPLSKTVLTGTEMLEEHILKPAHLFAKEGIQLKLGITVDRIERSSKQLFLTDGSSISYDKLVIATGSRPFIPQIKGLRSAKNLFTLRTAEDSKNIQEALASSQTKRVVIIGGGYIGLEAGASLRKLGANVSILEREKSVLARVDAPQISDFLTGLHKKNGIQIQTNKNVSSIESKPTYELIVCEDGSHFKADIIILGVGVKVNMELAKNAGLNIEDGIQVDSFTKTSDPDILAIGDCSYHYNLYYDRYIRLESIQNASDQAKTAAKTLCGEELCHEALPWFWSDQFDTKLQIVGISQGHNDSIVRNEDTDSSRFSVWYFKDEKLLAVYAVNSPKAYVLGSMLIKRKKKINKLKLANLEIDLKPAAMVDE